jgi:hypothetical protein
MTRLGGGTVSTENLVEIRKRAQEAVADMPEGDLKTKAFEVILQHLLSSAASATSHETASTPRIAAGQSRPAPKKPGTTKSRILLLKDEGFFAVPRALIEVRSELQAHGWILPRTTLSGPLQALVQVRELRRIKESHAKKKVWKYVNP